MMKWTLENIPNLKNKVAIVTGGTNSVGFETALILAKHGARVIITGPDQDEGLLAIKKISEKVPEADITYETLDLGSLKSINYFTDHMRSTLSSLDILILNEEVKAAPKRLETKDHFELTFGVNYLAQYTIAANLYPLISRTTDSRVITVSSLVHKEGMMNFDDLNSRLEYDASEAYAQSKLAVLLFTQELHRRARHHQEFFRSISVHLGALQSMPKKIIPILFAATSPEARSGEYYGPNGYRELWGSYPAEAFVSVKAKNYLAASKLWEESERLSGATFPFPEEGLSFHH